LTDIKPFRVKIPINLPVWPDPGLWRHTAGDIAAIADAKHCPPAWLSINASVAEA